MCLIGVKETYVQKKKKVSKNFLGQICTTVSGLKLGCVMCIDARIGQEWFICYLFVSFEFGEAIVTVCTVQKMEVRIADQICLAC